MERPDVKAAPLKRERVSRRRSWRAASIVLSVALGSSARAFATFPIRESEFAKAVSISSDNGRSGCPQALLAPTVLGGRSLAGKVAQPRKASWRDAVVARRAMTNGMPDLTQEALDIVMAVVMALAPVLVPWGALLLYAVIASFFAEAPEPALGTETDEVRSQMGRKLRSDLKRPTLDYWKDVK
mmetsp:Transcript_34562/g.78979  ORF Transcript_34562/g.78979 Transcript_34562/m.78979 type:complete len:184 (+) Transcript_34562:64-615(+)